MPPYHTLKPGPKGGYSDMSAKSYTCLNLSVVGLLCDLVLSEGLKVVPA
jgi:hypothetical protein